jgi:hypothetical protein
LRDRQRLPEVARKLIKTTSSTSYATPEERIERSDVRKKFLQFGLTEEQLNVMRRAMLD